MIPGISTYLFLGQRLTPALLETMVQCGAQAIEVFAARHHFDYTDARAVRELAGWFRSNDVAASLHMPLYADAQWSRYTAPTLDLIAAAKTDRIAAQDEVKRALEAAEQVPFKTCVLHLGLKDEHWDNRTLDDSLTAIEHLQAFAAPLGVRLLLENLENEVATPQHLTEIVRIGHFDGIGFSLDVGRAHLMDGLPETSHAAGKTAVELAFETLGEHVVAVRLSDNHGMRDERLWPGQGSVDWKLVAAKMAALPRPLAMLDVAPLLEERDLKQNAERAWGLAKQEALR
jgi:sugar phosphate isomerase/epimerase